MCSKQKDVTLEITERCLLCLHVRGPGDSTLGGIIVLNISVMEQIIKSGLQHVSYLATIPTCCNAVLTKLKLH